MKAKAKDSAKAQSKKETAAKKVTRKITPKKITPKKTIVKKKRKESKEDMKKYEKGAASFYVVAISTLILVIIAASFAALIVSEVSRTSNDDLAQSAYDAALAGVEDAKLAFMSYQECKALPEEQRASKIFGTNGSVNCAQLVEWVDNDDGSCDMVAQSLGRAVMNKEGEELYDLENVSEEDKMGVLVQEGTANDGNAMNQYYTCTTISTQTDDYLGVLTTEDFNRATQIKFADVLGPDGEVIEDEPYEKMNRIRLSWHSFGDNAESGDAGKWFTWMQPNGTSTLGTTEVTPAMMTMTMVQTGPTFDLDSFNVSQGNQTNRGTLYFVPTSEDSVADGETYISLTDPNSETGNRVLGADALVQSNSKDQVNKPYIVHCDTMATQDYACMVDIDIPQPIGGSRNPDTFVVSMTASYGAPKTDYRLEFFEVENDTPMLLTLDDVQISIDSTGRANDLFRRVDTRLEATDASYPYPFFGLETLQTKSISRFETEETNDGADHGIHKNFATVCEYNFDDLTCH